YRRRTARRRSAHPESELGWDRQACERCPRARERPRRPSATGVGRRSHGDRDVAPRRVRRVPQRLEQLGVLWMRTSEYMNRCSYNPRPAGAWFQEGRSSEGNFSEAPRLWYRTYPALEVLCGGNATPWRLDTFFLH